MATNPLVESVFNLSAAEKLRLVYDLWDNLAEASDEVPVHDWQKRELRKRKAEIAESPDAVIPWEEAKQVIRGE